MEITTVAGFVSPMCLAICISSPIITNGMCSSPSFMPNNEGI